MGYIKGCKYVEVRTSIVIKACGEFTLNDGQAIGLLSEQNPVAGGAVDFYISNVYRFNIPSTSDS